MVYIKANNEIIKVYQRIILSMKQRVEWNGDIIIRKNTMILVGRVRSMYFELATRRVYSDIEELTFDSANAFEMGNNKLITNIINMLLYPFGKWGAIKGLNVEQDYMVLAALFSQIFKEIDVETYFTKTSLKFFINGIQITFEDAMEKCIAYIVKQQEIKIAEQNLKQKKQDVKKEGKMQNESKKTSETNVENKGNLSEKAVGGNTDHAATKGEESKNDKAVQADRVRKKVVFSGRNLNARGVNNTTYGKAGEENDNTVKDSTDSDIKYADDKIKNSEEEKSGAGLWHNMKWSVGRFDFKREEVDQKSANSHRIGNNFYMVPYECPDCGEHLHMVVYPQGRENVIDTDEGRVYITRAYTCDNCKKFYTAKPGKLLREGDAYVLDFDNDEYAARDYVQLLGRKGGKTGNCNFNMYEADYGKNVSSVGKRLSERCRKMELLTDEELEQILAQMDDGFFSDYEKERFLAIIEQELEYREKMRTKKFGEFGRTSDERAQDDEVDDSTKIADNVAYESEMAEDTKNMQKSEIQSDGGSIPEQKDYSVNDEQDNTKAEKRQSIFGKGKDKSKKNGLSDKEQAGKKGSFFNRFKKGDDKENISTENISRENISKDVRSDTVKNDNKVETLTDKYGVVEDKVQNTGNFDVTDDISENVQNLGDEILNDRNIENDNITEAKENTAVRGDSVKEEVAAGDEARTPNAIIIEERHTNEKKNTRHKKEDIVEKNNKSDTADTKISQKDSTAPEGVQVSFFDKITDESRTAKYSDIVENIKKIEASEGDEQEKIHYIDVLTKLCKAAAKKEIEYLLSHLPGNINFERYKRTKEKLRTYTQIDVEPYIKIVDAKRDKVEFDELNKLVSGVDRDNRDELLEMMERIKNGEYEKRNSDRFVDSLKKRVYAMDEAKLRGICPDPDEITFDEGIKALEEIEKGVFLPELKSNMLQLIDKKLTTLKTEECELLVRKLERDLEGKISDMSKIHFYDIRKMRDLDNTDKETSFVKVAVSTYAYATGKYEYPIVICDSSVFGSGKEGFIITPDHIFYKGLIKSGSIDVKSIDGVSSEKKGLVVQHSSKGGVKIPCTLGRNDEKNMADVLDSFIGYLKMKPESRSIEYMSKNDHKIKCCYRCGHVFTDGNVCPKCGSRFDG